VERISPETLVLRLKKIEGQVRGIQKMIEEGRECESIIIQLGAARSAIEGVGSLVLKNCMDICLSKKSEPRYDEVECLVRAIAIWGKVRASDKMHSDSE